jgi:hypothetical protein
MGVGGSPKALRNAPLDGAIPQARFMLDPTRRPHPKNKKLIKRTKKNSEPLLKNVPLDSAQVKRLVVVAVQIEQQ